MCRALIRRISPKASSYQRYVRALLSTYNSHKETVRRPFASSAAHFFALEGLLHGLTGRLDLETEVTPEPRYGWQCEGLGLLSSLSSSLIAGCEGLEDSSSCNWSIRCCCCLSCCCCAHKRLAAARCYDPQALASALLRLLLLLLLLLLQSVL